MRTDIGVGSSMPFDKLGTGFRDARACARPLSHEAVGDSRSDAPARRRLTRHGRAPCMERMRSLPILFGTLLAKSEIYDMIFFVVEYIAAPRRRVVR